MRWALPSTHSTSAASQLHVVAARAFRSATTLRHASTTAAPVASVVRLPPVTSLNPTVSVSATTGRMRSTSMPISSAAIRAIDARLPPMSGEPTTTVAVPSSLTCTVALEFMPPLNQNPLAMPRPWFGPRGSLRWGWSRIASRVSTKPMRGNFGPYDAWVPSTAAFLRRSPIGSIPISRARSSITLSTAKAAMGAPGAR